jgi:hypothetical protein
MVSLSPSRRTILCRQVQPRPCSHPNLGESWAAENFDCAGEREIDIVKKICADLRRKPEILYANLPARFVITSRMLFNKV